jgi:hypothetical protein
MSIIVACPACGRKLEAPDRCAGRKAKCSQCGGVVTVQALSAPVADKKMPDPRRREEIAPRTPKPPEPERHASGRAQAPRTKEPEPEVVEVELVESQEEEPPQEKERPKKRRKKKKRIKEDPSPANHAMLWWSIGLVALLALAGSGVLVAIQAGHGLLVFLIAIQLAIMVPLSAVILLVSMVISAQFVGGIDFGDVPVTIIKTVCLLLFINLLYLVPFGAAFSLPFWTFGLMLIYDLRFWEARLLVTINWLVNLVVKFFLITLVVTAITQDKHKDDFPEPPAHRAVSAQEQADLDAIESLGGSYDSDEDSDDPAIVSISLAGTRATDKDLARLANFPKLRSLDLSGTRISDDGLAHLKGLTMLRTLNLSRTRISDDGLEHLKQLPGLQVVNLERTKVTSAGIEALHTALPRLNIVTRQSQPAAPPDDP